jgi:hypothetical protein
MNIIGASLICLLIGDSLAPAVEAAPDKPAQSTGAGIEAPGADAPTPADPYPLDAAGWGPEAGNGRFASRWAEDWTGMRAADRVPPFKAMPLGGEASLTLSAEGRLRYDSYDNGRSTRGNDYQQLLFRGILGADLRLDSHVRVYGEIGTGQVDSRRSTAAANLQNDASLQQLFLDSHAQVGSALVGAMVGRQEFADGPRQLISLGDGSNLHRTWNGARLYAHCQQFRLGAFAFCATEARPGAFDERINHAERLGGLNASLAVTPGAFLDPFWIHSVKPNFRSGGQVGLDERDTWGVRCWRRLGDLGFDWTLAYQSGDYREREVSAWGLFAVQSLALSDQGWRPRLTSHVDIASGGGAYGSGTLADFNPLYTGSAYLGEGLFFSLSNLLLIASGVSISPVPGTRLSAEYGFARRLEEGDAAYAAGMQAYAGTQQVPGHEIGGLLRVAGTWSASEHLAFFFTYEHLDAGEVLRRVHLASGSYAYVGATFHY